MHIMKSIPALVLLMAIVTTLTAQPLVKTEKINEEQVPVNIRSAFEKDFGKLSDGYWTATFMVEREGNRTAAKPLAYTYRKKSKSEKIEVRYNADGKLEFAKGIEKNPDTNS